MVRLYYVKGAFGANESKIGIGTGGTADGNVVVQSQEISCLPERVITKPEFTLSVDTPPSAQCGTTTMHYIAGTES